jgi:hypothetical protein
MDMSVFWSMYGTHVAAQDASGARRAAAGAEARVAELEGRLDRALLACEAMWTILRDKLGVTEEELVARVNDLDLSDGKLDGKVRRQATVCPNCNRNVARRFARCIYCGTPMGTAQDAFA